MTAESNTSRQLDAATIDRARVVSVADVALARGLPLKRSGNELFSGCPRCGGEDRFAISIRKNVFLCRQCYPKGGGNAVTFIMWLDGCDFFDAVRSLIGEPRPPIKRTPVPVFKNPADRDRRQHEKARWLWSQRQRITGSIAEAYLREARGITCALPPTLGFLQPRKADQHPAMIAAFGRCDEVEPGVVATPRDVIAVHLTLLRPDGTGKAEVTPNKLMIGSPSGKPIVIAPPNDLLGLAITEGIEEALTAYQETGLGAWAAGSAGFMPKISHAVPDYIGCVCVFADANQAGESNSALLAEQLRQRGIHAEVLPLAEVRS